MKTLEIKYGDWTSGIMRFDSQESLDYYLKEKTLFERFGISGDPEIIINDMSGQELINEKEDRETEENFNKGKLVKKFIARINKSKGQQWMAENAIKLLTKYCSVNSLLTEGFLSQAAEIIHAIKESGDFSIYSEEEADSILSYIKAMDS